MFENVVGNAVYRGKPPHKVILPDEKWICFFHPELTGILVAEGQEEPFGPIRTRRVQKDTSFKEL